MPVSTEWKFVVCAEGAERVKNALQRHHDAPCEHRTGHAHFIDWLTIYYGRPPSFEELTGAMLESHDNMEVRYYGQRLHELIASIRKDRLGEEIWVTALREVAPVRWKPRHAKRLPSKEIRSNDFGL